MKGNENMALLMPYYQESRIDCHGNTKYDITVASNALFPTHDHGTRCDRLVAYIESAIQTQQHCG